MSIVPTVKTVFECRNAHAYIYSKLTRLLKDSDIVSATVLCSSLDLSIPTPKKYYRYSNFAHQYTFYACLIPTCNSIPVMRYSPRNGDAIEMLLKARTSTQTTVRLEYVLYFIMQDYLQITSVFSARGFKWSRKPVPEELVGGRLIPYRNRIYLVADKSLSKDNQIISINDE